MLHKLTTGVQIPHQGVCWSGDGLCPRASLWDSRCRISDPAVAAEAVLSESRADFFSVVIAHQATSPDTGYIRKGLGNS